MVPLKNFITHPDPDCCTHPDKYDPIINSATRHLLSSTYFPSTSLISFGTSTRPFCTKDVPMCLPNITASSNAWQPPCPRSGVMGCMASPATVTFCWLKLPNTTCQGYLNISGAHVSVERSECCTTSEYKCGRSLA